MDDQPQNPISQSSTTSPGYHEWREPRRAERLARQEAHWQRRIGRSFGWIGGAILILLGMVFLLQNMGIPFLTNWWALFILIPAFWAYVAAWENYQEHGRLTQSAAGPMTVGILLTILSLAFLFNVTDSLFWPVLLILGGLVLLVNALLPR